MIYEWQCLDDRMAYTVLPWKDNFCEICDHFFLVHKFLLREKD